MTDTALSSEYLFFFLQGERFKKLVAERVAGSGVPHLFQADMKTLLVYAPKNLHKQKKIAKILTTVDNLIEKTQSLIDKYTAIKQGMMTDLFTRGIDLSGTPDTNPNYGQLRPPVDQAPELYKETELGWVPREWGVTMLGEISDVIDPQPDHRTPPESNSGIPYVGVGDFFGNHSIDRSKCRRVIYEAYEKQKKRFQISKGDIIFGKIGTIGQPKQLQETEGFALSANILLIQAKDKNGFVYAFLHSEIFNTQLNNIVNTTSQPALGIQTMRDIKVIYPSNYNEVIKIQMMFSKVDNALRSCSEALGKYKHLKQGLMQDLLTGKVKVS